MSEPVWVPLALGAQPAALGELAYAAATSAVNITATTAVTANTVVTAPATVFDGSTPVLLDFSCPYVQVPPGQSLSVHLYQDGVLGQLLTFALNPDVANLYVPLSAQRRFTPPAGSHTYSIRAHVSGGTGIVSAGADGAGLQVPAFIRISLASPMQNAAPGQLLPVSYGTSLPGGPLDGQEAILVDSLTNPTYSWRFRYNAGNTTAYKWEFIGGAELFHDVTTEETLVNDTAAHAFPTNVTITVPRAGTYMVRGSARIYTSASTRRSIAPNVAGTGFPGTPPYGDANGSDAITNAFIRPLTIGAGVTVALWYQFSSAPGTVSGASKTIAALPVRVA